MATGYTGKRIRLSNNGSIPHTLREIARISTEYASQVLDESALLEGRTDRETALNIWHFVRKNVEYEEDSTNGNVELLRRPARTLHDGVGDCDCATILISAILKNLDLPHYYKVVGYSQVGAYEHIYPVLIDRQTNKHIAIDFVPEVPTQLYELPYIDEKIYNPQDGKIMVTEELGCAQKDPYIRYIKELPPPPPLDFYNATMGECGDVEHIKAINVLEHIANVTASIPNTSPLYEQAQSENELVKVILQNPDADNIKQSLKNVYQYESDFEPVYAQLQKGLESATLAPVEAMQNFLNGLNGFPIAETLQLVTTIGAQYMAGNAIDKQNAQDEFNASLNLENTKAQVEGQQAILDKQAQIAREAQAFELEKIKLLQQQNQQNNMMAVQKNTSVAKTDTPPPTEKKWYEKDWAKYTGIGLLVLIVLFAIYYFTMKKSKPLNGAKRRRKITRKSVLNGAKRATHKRRRTRSLAKATSYKLPKPKVRAKAMNGRRKTTRKKTATKKTNSKKRTSKK